MAKKKTDDLNRSLRPRASAPRKRTTPAAESIVPDELAASSTPSPIAIAADMPAPSTPEGVVDNPPYHPSYEEIAEAAYQRFLERGGTHGRDFDDWVEAERQLRSRR